MMEGEFERVGCDGNCTVRRAGCDGILDMIGRVWRVGCDGNCTVRRVGCDEKVDNDEKRVRSWM